MRFGVLGPLAAWNDRGEPVAVPGRKVRALLAVLLVHEGRTVSVDRLVEDLWPEAAPADPVAALHVRVSQLRRALAAGEPSARDLVESRSPGYALRIRPDMVDSLRFEALIERARRHGEARSRAGLLAEALRLWRGAVLADFADEPFAQAPAARWEERRLAALEAQAEARLALGEHRELVAELGELTARHPYREGLRASHMRALHRAGRTGEALESFAGLRRVLADELGLDPGPDLADVHRAILAADPAEDAPAALPAPPASNLPAPLTELFGRDEAVRRLCELLAVGRLVTVTGPGGVGKTSAALAAARSLTDSCPDGTWLVDLTAWDGTGDAAEPILSALSLQDSPDGSDLERLSAALRDRRMLLVLDNCEHVVDRVAETVAALLPAAPGLRVLATSREPLRLSGETRWELPPLDLPDTDDPARLAETAAVRLFLNRSGLDSGSRTVAAVAEVCRRLDGLPLALELAATRARALGPAELAARLRMPRDRFGLLGTGPRDAPDRQRTLAAVIDWSWRMLTETEQAVLRRLSVHTGGFALEAAEAVCAGDGVADGEVLDLLASLADRSLVARRDGRFHLLESVAAFSLDRLREAAEEAALRRRHADHYLALAERAAPLLRGPEQREWLLRLDAETANLRAALETFRREGAAEEALRLAVAQTWHRMLRGRLVEAGRALDRALAVPGEADGAIRAEARVWRLALAIQRGAAGPEQVGEALREYEKVAAPVELARARWLLAASVVDHGDQAAVGDLFDQALDVFRSEGDRWGEAAVLSQRAILAHMRGDVAALEADARGGAELFAAIGDDWGVLQATDWLIGLADLTGDHAEAERLSREGLRLAERLGLWGDVAGRLAWLAWTAMHAGDYPAALEQAERSRRMAAEQGQVSGEVFAAVTLAYASRRDGRPEEAELHLRWLLATARKQQSETASPPYLAMVLSELGMLALERGDASAALDWHRECFDDARRLRAPDGMAWGLEGMAIVLASGGRTATAARLLGAASAVRREPGRAVPEVNRAEVERIEAAVRAAEPDFEELFASGAELTPDQARSLVDRA